MASQRAIGALPNEYLYYFYRNREAVAAIGAADSTRGEYLLAQQERFYADTAADPAGALERWTRVREERDASYMADAVVLLRMFEHQGKVKKAISVVKKRSGNHEEAIRQIWFDSQGVHLGPPLLHLRGVLAGVPVEVGIAETSPAPAILPPNVV